MTVVSLPRPAVAERGTRTGPVALVRSVLTGRTRAVAVTAATAVLATAALVHADARADLRSEQAALQQARLEEAVAADDAARSTVAVAAATEALAEARDALSATVERVDGVRADLTDRTDERDDLQARLAVATEELDGVRGNLVAGFTALGLQGEQIASLDACLNGLSRALLQLAFEDDAGATRSLAAVATPCAAASGALDVLPGRS
jgi:chromosome segregation ATPase